MADPNEIAKQFVEYYYTKFDTNRAELAALYRDESMLTFENAQIQGQQHIVNHLVNLQFAQPQHLPQTMDVQPLGNGLLVFVSGQLKTGPNENAMMYSQVFTLMPDGQNSSNFFVLNDIFKLNLAMS